MDMNEGIQSKIEGALVVNLYKQAMTGFIASIICSSIVFFYLYHINPGNLTVIAWYSVFLFIILMRSLLVDSFLRKSDRWKNLAFWRNTFVLGAFLSGLSWGFTGTSLLLPSTNPMVETFMLIILAGISAGAVPLLAHVRSAAIGFLLPSLLPLIIHFFAFNYEMYTLFNIAISVYLVYLITLTFKTHAILKNSLHLQFENEILLQNLYEVKNQLEITNNKLQQAATHDPLTHVANRNLFELKFLEALNRAEQEKKILVLLYLDLDGFKDVNDHYGHNAGDQLLLIIVSRMKNILREKDIISRLGGDELTIILEDVEDVQTIAEIANRICQTISKPIKINDNAIRVHSSIGISIYPIDGTDMDTLLRVADRAMYYVKDHGGNNFHFNVQIDSTK